MKKAFVRHVKNLGINAEAFKVDKLQRQGSLVRHLKWAITCLFVLLAISLANAAIDFNIFYIDGNADNGGLPAFSFARDGNLKIDVNAMDNNYTILLLDLNYSTSEYTYGAPIVDDLNLNSYADCQDNNFNDSTQCSVYFDISAVADGNYFISGVVRDAGNPADYRFAVTDNNFMVDNTAPVTTADANAGWQNFNADVRITCSDINGSGGQYCFASQNKYYRRDADPSAAVSYGAWGTHDFQYTTISFTADGNWALDYYTIDPAGNTETIKTTYVLVDKNAPDMSIILPAGNSTASNILQFDVNKEYGSEINANALKADINGAASDLNFSQHCAETSYGYRCTWSEPSLVSGNDYNLAVFAKDSVEWRATAQKIFTYIVPPENNLPGVNVAKLDGNRTNEAMAPKFDYYIDGNFTIDFNAWDKDWNGNFWGSGRIDVNIDARKVDTNVSIRIVTDLNITKAGYCDDQNFARSYAGANGAICHWDWNVIGAADGNYTIDMNISDGNATTVRYGDFNFFAQNIAPTIPAPGSLPDIDIYYIDGYADNSGLPAFSYARDGLLTIDFNVQDETPASLLLDMNYSSQNVQGTGAPIAIGAGITAVDDLNLNSYAGCDDSNFMDSTHCSIDWNIMSIADGNYYILASLTSSPDTAIESSDNNFLIDNTKPVIIFTLPASGEMTTNAFTVKFDINDSGGSGVDGDSVFRDTNATDINTAIVIGSGSWDVNYTGTSTVSNVPDGDYNVTIRAADKAGNQADQNTALIHYDTTAPVVSNLTPVNDANINSIPTISFDVNETVGASGINPLSIVVYLNEIQTFNFSPENCTGLEYSKHCEYTETDINSDGTWSITVRAYDYASNMNPVTTTFTYDTTKPVISITPPEYTEFADNDFVIKFFVDDNGSDVNLSSVSVDVNFDISGLTEELQYWTADGRHGFSYSLNGSIADGDYNITIGANDYVGNSADKNYVLLHYDATAPNPAYLDDLPEYSDLNYVDLNWTSNPGSDAGSGLAGYIIGYSRVDLGEWEILATINAGTTTYTHSNLIDANYCYAIQTNDNVGNGFVAENIECTYVDTNAPAVSVASVSTTSNSATITYSGFDSGSGIKEYWVKLDSGEWESNGSATSKTYSGLSAGTYTFYLKASDYADLNSSDANTNFTISAGNGGPPGGGGPGGGPSPPTPTLQCTDTDKGDNIFTFGYSYARRGNSAMTLLQLDKCSDKSKPNEMDYDIIEAICTHEQPKGTPRKCPAAYHCATTAETINDTLYNLAACVPDENAAEKREEAGEEGLFERFREQVAEKLAELMENLSEKVSAFMEANPIVKNLVSIVLEKRAIASEREKAIRDFEVNDAEIAGAVGGNIAEEEINLEMFEVELRLFSGHFKKHLYLALKGGSEEEKKLLYKQIKGYLKEVERGT